MHSRDQERERLESNDPQPGMSRFDRGWEAANGVNSLNLREPRDIVDDLTMSAGALTARQVAIYAGDRTSARAMLEAAEVCKRAADEIERLRRNTGCARNQGTTQFCAEALDAQREIARLRAELRSYTGDGHAIVEPFIPEAM